MKTKIVMLAVMYLFSCNIGDKPAVVQQDAPAAVVYDPAADKTISHYKETISLLVRLAYVTGHSDGMLCRNASLEKYYPWEQYNKDRSRDSLVYEQDVVSQLFK